MKKIILYWIAIQMILIGIIGTTMFNQVREKTFSNCTSKGDMPYIIGVTFPLIFFVPDHQEMIDYCNSKK